MILNEFVCADLVVCLIERQLVKAYLCVYIMLNYLH